MIFKISLSSSGFLLRLKRVFSSFQGPRDFWWPRWPLQFEMAQQNLANQYTSPLTMPGELTLGLPGQAPFDQSSIYLLASNSCDGTSNKGTGSTNPWACLKITDPWKSLEMVSLVGNQWSCVGPLILRYTPIKNLDSHRNCTCFQFHTALGHLGEVDFAADFRDSGENDCGRANRSVWRWRRFLGPKNRTGQALDLELLWLEFPMELVLVG